MNLREGSYASQQSIQSQNRTLPDGWNDGKRNFVIFNSSEDNFLQLEVVAVMVL
jgi:hypothetical protein